MTAALRPLTIEDSAALAVIDAVCFGQEAWSEQQIAGSLALPTTRGIGCERDGRLIGFLLLQCVADEAEILTLGVLPQERRKGFAQKMIAEALEASAIRAVFLDVAVDNSAAQRLYEKLGFTVFARRKGYYRRGSETVDAINYRRVVTR